jgi:hypothetical protein
MLKIAQAAFAASMVLAPCAAMAADFDGTWKSNPSSWKATTPNEYVLVNGTYTCLAGCYIKQAIPADGADHAVTGVPYLDTFAVIVLNDHAAEFVGKKNGAKVSDATSTVSADGKTMSTNFSNASNTNGGAPVTGAFTEARVGGGPAGAHAISGKWRFDGASGVSDNGTLTTFKLDGDTLTMTQPTGQSYTAVIGGPDAPYQGDPGIDTVSLRRVGPHAIEETDKFKGAVVWIGTSTVSDDGTTMTTVWEDKRNNSGGSGTATKQ